ncbi:MAG: hypothetical protein RR826_03925 [Christensenellaceae bacterium]
MKKLLKTIYEKIRTTPYCFQLFEDLHYMSKEAMKTDIPLGVKYLKLLSAKCEEAIHDRSLSDEQVRELFDLHKRVCFTAAWYDFDSYLLYVE